jgi:hypothetical protein
MKLVNSGQIPDSEDNVNGVDDWWVKQLNMGEKQLYFKTKNNAIFSHSFLTNLQSFQHQEQSYWCNTSLHDELAQQIETARNVIFLIHIYRTEKFCHLPRSLPLPLPLPPII